jgi:enoyl-CoA hydratase
LFVSTVLTETQDTIRILTLNRPEKRNAINMELQQALLAAVRAAAADKALRALVLTGAGSAFSAGADRSLMQAMAAGPSDLVADLGRVLMDTVRAFLELEIPVIAAVNGFAVGSAAGFVALCDMVVMGENAFMADPHVQAGIAANPVVQAVWPRLCSEVVARELILSGRSVGAAEALRIGLCNRVCPDGEEQAAALAMAEMFTALPATGMAAIKRAFNAPLLAALT